MIAKDYSGSHALQSLLLIINSQEEIKVLNVFSDKEIFIELSCDPYGCYIIQKMFNLYDDEDKGAFTNLMINEIDLLMNDTNGFKTVYYF
jgi:hypothetical protein